MHHPLLSLPLTAKDFARAAEALYRGRGPVAAFGLPEAHKSHIAASLATAPAPGRAAACDAENACNTILLVTSTDTAAVRMRADIAALGVPASLLLQRETPLVRVMNASGDRTVERVRALMQLLGGSGGAVVSSMGALLQRLAPREAFLAQCIRIESGDEVAPRTLIERFTEAGYERVAMVEGRGQIALRGGIVDVYATDARYPVRIEFWGDTVDQMRTFDPVTQRSIEQVTRASFAPAFETPQPQAVTARALKAIKDREEFAEQYAAWSEGHACAGADALLPLLYKKLDTVLDYLPSGAYILVDEPHRLEEAARAAEIAFSDNVSALLERGEGLPLQGNLQQSAPLALESLSTPRTMALYTLARTHPAFPAKELVQSLARTAPQYMGSFEELARDIALWKRTGEAAVLFAGEHGERLHGQLADLGADTALAGELTRAPVPGETLIVGQMLPRGFCYPELHLTVLGEQELFGKAAAPEKRGKKRGAPRLSELAVGDYVVHETHGIGRFVGVETLTVQDNTRDYLLLEYRGGDKLYIPTDQMDRVQKYIGGGDEDTLPHLSKLGGSDWQNRVTRAKESAKKLAVDLAALYAERIGSKGFAFSKDSPWQVQMEERFPYRETADQLESIREIKADMERARPMDRLLCGDVGYGKTEVALRAAFKAVQDSKQVAFLVPTTILAQQHYHTLTARFADFPVRTACLSRFTTAAEKKDIKAKLEKGAIDILVGTHALLAKDVRFKDLGLIIVDEEQRFGVNHKEKLKELKREVDVLTLTATPIPRTLNMSMTGVRDISVMETPPESRYPVQTYVLEYTDALVVDAVTKELARGGQAYIVYNRVQSMEAYVRKLSELLPEVRFAMGHGQMPEGQLEKTMLGFLEHETDVLVCSTIIESGLDIPNVNTMIVIDADRFGLSQLYQLRGRVGRSTRIGYAYLTVRRGASMSEEAHKRLMAIREFTQFGAGFRLAMRDLEIRGAGSLLGAEQHGHIADIGYEYYCKLMQRAVAEVKGEAVLPEAEVNLDIPVSAHIPKGYIANEVQRLSAYRRIADAATDDALYDVREELEDRYGEPPSEVENMLLLAAIRIGAARAMLGSIAVREGEATLLFAPDARPDGARLIAAVTNMANARLIASDPPGIKLRQRGAAPKDWLKLLPQFVYTIASCAPVRDGL